MRICGLLLLEHAIRCQCAWTIQTSAACGAPYDQNQCGHIVGVSSQAGKLATA
jgi:short-subunit dehydrogenase